MVVQVLATWKLSNSFKLIFPLLGAVGSDVIVTLNPHAGACAPEPSYILAHILGNEASLHVRDKNRRTAELPDIVSCQNPLWRSHASCLNLVHS